MIVRSLAYAISLCYLLLGVGMAGLTQYDIQSGAYPWADHIPALCVLVGALAALCNAAGFALIMQTRAN